MPAASEPRGLRGRAPESGWDVATALLSPPTWPALALLFAHERVLGTPCGLRTAVTSQNSCYVMLTSLKGVNDLIFYKEGNRSPGSQPDTHVP